jgi:hypothetical protein
LLPGRAATESEVSAAQDRVPANVGVRVDQNYGRTTFGRLDCRGQPGCSSPDDDDVRFLIPVRRPSFGLRCFDSEPGERCGAGSRSSCLDKISARDIILILFIAFHKFDPNLRF